MGDQTGRRAGKRGLKLTGLAVLAVLFGQAAARGQEPQTDAALPINFYGAPGLLEMPSGHMGPDGAFRFSVAYANFTQRYSLTFQALPWLQASFHYIGTKNFSPSYSTYYDRSFGLKIRLQDEQDGWPEISVGALDIAGTSLLSGEYLVGSKHLGPVDVTLGMGWGRLAGTGLFRNPFTYILPSFKRRNFYSTGTRGVGGTGQIQFGQFFRGPKASLFGGIVWQTPLKGLTLIGEYSSDNYSQESARGAFKPDMQFNIGASYAFNDWANITAAWLYGNTAMVQVSVHSDPTRPQLVARLGPAPLPAHLRSEAELRALARPTPALVEPAIASVGVDGREFVIMTRGGVAAASAVCERLTAYLQTAHDNGFQEVAVSDVDDPTGAVRFCKSADAEPSAQARLALFIGQSAADKAKEAAEQREVRRAARRQAIAKASAQGLKIENLSIEGDAVDIAFENTHYRTETEAYGRLTRVLMDTMPDDINQFRLTSLVGGMPARQMTIPRSSLERVIRARGNSAELLPAIDTQNAPADPDVLSLKTVDPYPRFDWAIRPEYTQSLFDPDRPYRFQLLLGLQGGVDIARGLRVQGEFQVNLVDNFANLRGSNSLLPHVRSDFKEYYQQGKTGFSQMQASYRTTLGRGLFAEAKAGYFESMFAGVGGEMLWRPEGKRWAIGVSAYEVWQRGFDRLADLRDYHVLTGHVNFYYQLPYHGLNLRIHAGRYLAGDYGATFEIVRRFDTGVEIGAFATLTNVPFSKFGEGSFDKGIVLRFPVDWLAPVNSQSQFAMTLRPLTRDGGQVLANEYDLYDATTRTSYGDVLEHFDNIISP